MRPCCAAACAALALLVCSVSAIAGDVLLESIQGIQVISIRITQDNLNRMNAAADHKCAALEKGRAQPIEEFQVPVIHAKVEPSMNYIARACIGRQMNDSCVVAVQGTPAPGLCLPDFVTSSKTLRCIIAEVLEATDPCLGKQSMDFCVVNFSTDTEADVKHEVHGGVCGHDSRGVHLGCFTSTGAKFLQSIENDAIEPFQPVAVEVTVDEFTWHNVLARRHGGASLCTAMNRLSRKLPLHLDFRSSTFEDSTSHEMTPASFYPFNNRSRVTLKGNSFSDPSLLRQFVGSLLARRAGLFVPESSLIRVNVNHAYVGLYTLTADLTASDIAAVFPRSTTALPAARRQLYVATRTRLANNIQELSTTEGQYYFVTNATDDSTDSNSNSSSNSSSSPVQAVHAMHQDIGGAVPQSVLQPLNCSQQPGALYAPTCTLQYFQPNSFVTTGGAPEYPWYTHAVALHSALHDPARTSSPADWRAGLEQVLQIRDGPSPFLLWLAVNTLLGNWDTYGQVPHNFQLYAPPCGGRLALLGNDFDQIWTARSRKMTVNHGAVGLQWPLIRHVLDDPVYSKEYRALLRKLLKTLFDKQSLVSELESLHRHIYSHVHPEEGGEDEDVTRVDYGAFENSLHEIQDTFKAVRQNLVKELKASKQRSKDDL